VVCAFAAFTLSAQSDSGLEKRSEVKINVMYMLVDAAEITYERILNSESSIGVSATYVLVPEAEYGWGVTPYYRLFFGKQPAQGFFVEGHGSIFDFEDFDWVCANDACSRIAKRYTTGGLGLAVGLKFRTKSDIILEMYAGAGRILSDVNYGGTYPRAGISVGKLF